MSELNDLSTIALPALRARMGDWVYYICFMRMQDISARISFAKEIHTSKSLQDLLQRQLTNRSREIAHYLVSQKQRFFNALVVGTYGGNPQWNELAIKNTFLSGGIDFQYFDGALGILTLTGNEKLFAIDGQHRVAGIRQALNENPQLNNEEVCIIFVAGVTQAHKEENPIGFERTRRLFTTLNRYAKPVGKKDIIALDEDDVVAIVTRKLVEEYRLFIDKISLIQTKNIPISDKQSLTTIVTLYDALDIYLRLSVRGWVKFKKFRPPDDKLVEYYNEATNLWDVLAINYPPLTDLRDSDPAEKVAGKYRQKTGGHLLFRPIGLLLIIRVVRILIDIGNTLEEAVRRISTVPMELSNKPWAGLLWDTTNQRMITSPENQKAALKLFFYSVGGDLSKMRTNTIKLRQELGGLLNLKEEDVELPLYV